MSSPVRVAVALLLSIFACKPESDTTAGPATTPPTTTSPTPTSPPESTPPVTTPPSAPPSIPSGSGDYSAALADAKLYQARQIDLAELQRRVIARALPPHPLGDDYLMIPVPAPPPGVAFDPLSMPRDWERNWGEVAMTFWAGAITRDEYDRLHAAAHPQCKR